MDVIDIIRTKRDGGELSAEEIAWVIQRYTAGEVAEEQMAALAMAIFWRGLAPAELASWTTAMIDSGDRLDLSEVGRPTVDKHSTGGVGDKITLPLAPLVAACGVAVPQLSGRGLGHTGGTLDKLEAIPGWRAELSTEAMIRQLREVGAVICAAGAGLAPADRKLYALRDVTGTVESIPLIASSIMSKKIAEGTDALVLDVKVGSGAFMRDLRQARQLAETMVELGTAAGLTTTALLTRMDQPLGRAVGNAIEVAESIAVLQGEGPADVTHLTLELARAMVRAAGVDADPAARLADGSAYEVWQRMIRAQGGDPDAPLPRAAHRRTVTATEEVTIGRIDAHAVGRASWQLGAGRDRPGARVQAGAGIEILAQTGETVRRGDPLFELHSDTPERFEVAEATLAGAVVEGEHQPADLVIEKVGT
ncbi:thymidine phosphorylase [Parenemella sanctibonifatiensis]|uniref:Thymidine phosphorylase n=1 Tax=Parenemella sanctibonifatiensis TaxID=2016505 RepID=A0A255EQV2_9ACTN|nr:thymidine phosphorylase [Parenemella sanctibonifatiensis]OYN90503.1 thymidine phosphorylase [Parenemella sanctibonifatiensis]